MTTPLLICNHLVKFFGNVGAVYDLNLSVNKGEILALIGPSGCGKTTLLRLLAGFEKPDGGSIYLNDQPLVDGQKFVSAQSRRIGFVFQEYALFPHLSVHENIAFGLHSLPKAQRQQITSQMLGLVNLEHAANRFPHEISGGERQRVALARALAPQPDVLLLDEPFSNLDADRRLVMRTDIRQILRQQHVTAVFVTHDQEEAFYMGDRLAVMLAGQIWQIGQPEGVFQRPSSRAIAEFLGGTEFLPGIVEGTTITTPLGKLAQQTGLPGGSRVDVGVRADDINFKTEGPPNAVITERIYRGAYQVYRLRLEDGGLVSAMQSHTRMLPVGQTARAYLDPGHELAVYYAGQLVD